jgi:hypothetical protein
MSTSARTNSGDLVIPRVIVTDFNTCVLQRVRDGLGLWALEWFLDQSAGFPWWRILGQKNISATEAAAFIRQFLLSVEGIVSVTATAMVNATARSFAYAFQAQLNSGAVLTGGSGQAFKVTGGP